MVKLEDVINEEGDGRETARRLSNELGVDPLMILLDAESKGAIKASLDTLMKELKSQQREVLKLTMAGYTVRAMAAELNRDHSTIVTCRQSIGRRLFNVADEDRMEALRVQMSELARRGKFGSRYRKLDEEYRRRYAVREALKNLFVTLPEVVLVSRGARKTKPPTLLFERKMKVVRGYRAEEKNGRTIVKPIVRCELKKYFEESFGDGATVCTLCKRCRAEKEDACGDR